MSSGRPRQVADAANDETRLRAAVDSSSGALSAPAGASERVRTKAAIDEKEALDRLFLEQVDGRAAWDVQHQSLRR